ncbi:tetratricopeptide repeat protein [Allorhodopirellula heiligendammensis]|uniref:Tetratricopeptide repeat protein n=1 Tax=Allorhodopirellula heiligendammensis TaxID=2714739 RepID=A0A5C6BGE1_9BACT|nr:tetratricopeptide repeat protein [Allorhodopirellula heiligendammensis]TWU10707.1 Tetratricopeptide repeat protein [Allorhodopirellula heiligendammensis]
MIRCLSLCLFLVAGSAVAQEQPAANNSPPNLSAEEQQIHQFFADFETATRADSVDEQIQFFDFDELTRDIVEQSGVAMPPGLQSQLATVMQTQIKQQFELLDAPWTRHRIVRIEFSDDKSIADVFVRSWSVELGTARESYLLKKIDDQWRICDVSQLSIGVSMVALSSLGLRDTMQSNIASELVYAMQKITQCATECAQGNVYAAMDHIDGILGYPMPESMQALRWTLSAIIHGAIDPEKTIESLEKAEAFGESTLLADYLRGEAYLELGRFEVAINHFRDYVNHFGADADAYYSLGYALEQLDRIDEAIDAYKAALADTPESVDNVSALALALPDSRKEEFVTFYRNLPDPTSSFEQVGDAFVYASDAPALRTLIDTMVTIDPAAEYMDYYRAMLEHLEGNYRVAFDSLAESLSQMDTEAEARTWYEYALCDAARQCDRIDQAYAMCVDKAQAIDTLTNRTDIQGEPLPDAASQATIDALLEKYLLEHDNAFDALMLVGRSHAGREEYPAASECFVKAMSSTDDPDERYEALEECVYCYVSMDRALDAYNEFEPKSDVVEILEYALDDGEALTEILEKFQADEPDSLRFVWTTLQEMLEQGEYQPGLDRVDLALSEAGLSGDGGYEETSLVVYRTRFLIGLKRYDDAILAAHSLAEDSREFIRALVYAAKGDRRQFDIAYQRCLAAEGMYGAESFAEAPEVPVQWLPDSSEQTGDEAEVPFSPYTQVRRVVLLLDEPRSVNAGSVIAASREIGEPLYAIDRRQMTAEEDDYVFQASDYSVIVATQRCRYFIQAGDGPYLHNADLLAEDLDTDEELSELIRQHSAWLAIDIFQWPQGIDQDSACEIPDNAGKLLAQFARQLVGDGATVAIHSDMQIATRCNEEFFVKLSSDTPISAFEAAE